MKILLMTLNEALAAMWDDAHSLFGWRTYLLIHRTFGRAHLAYGNWLARMATETAIYKRTAGQLQLPNDARFELGSMAAPHQLEGRPIEGVVVAEGCLSHPVWAKSVVPAAPRYIWVWGG